MEFISARVSVTQPQPKSRKCTLSQQSSEYASVHLHNHTITTRSRSKNSSPCDDESFAATTSLGDM